MRWLLRSNFRSFYLLNATQFLGALNDNIFKLLVIYLLISVKGPAAANTILSLAGAIFVIPFLLFSSGAGVLADKISKRTIIVSTKILEIVIMLYGVMSVYFQWAFGSYIALFLMATQSAIFGPSKYGIIPEIVEGKMVSRVNGSLTSFTYLAIILGTFLASFLTDITNKNFVLVALFSVFIAIIGFLTSLGISRTEPQRSPKKINPVFLYEIYQTLKTSWSIPYLLPCIFSSAFFLFVGAFTQLNIIPFAMQSLHLTEVGGGYLFLATAVGIAVGAVLAGRLSKDKVEPGISCIAGFFIAFFFLLLGLFSESLPMTIILLWLLGIAGGAYLIPFDAYLQINSPHAKRGQIIAASNFFSFVGVLLAALCLYLFSEEFGLKASSGFVIMGLLAGIANVITTGRLSPFFLAFFASKILKQFRHLKLLTPVPNPSTLVILHSNSWLDALLLFSCLPRLKVLLPDPYFRRFPWINGLIDAIRLVPPEPTEKKTHKKLLEQVSKLQRKHNSVCLFFYRRSDSEPIIKAYTTVFSQMHYKIVFAHGHKERIARKFLFFRFHQKQISLHFSKD